MCFISLPINVGRPNMALWKGKKCYSRKYVLNIENFNVPNIFSTSLVLLVFTEINIQSLILYEKSGRNS